MPSNVPLIHIGYQKTASTFLQRRIFADDSTFALPWGAQSALGIEHFLLAHPETQDVDAVRASLGDHPDRIPVVSQEDLSGYPIHGQYYAASVAQRIKHIFPQAKVLICIREQTSMLVSQYFQYARQGGDRTLKALLEANDNRPGFRPVLRKDHFEYDLMYQTFRRHFDADQVLVLPYELLKHDAAAYFGNLNSFLGTSLDPAMAGNVVHAKRGAAAMRLELFFNKILPTHYAPPPDYKDYPLYVRMRNRVVRVFDNFASKYTNIGKSFEADLAKVVQQSVGDHFAASNRRMSQILDYDLAQLGYLTADKP